MTFPFILSRMAQTVTGIVFAASLFVAVAAAEESSAPPGVVESLPDLSADLQTTSVDRNGHTSVTTVHIYRSGKLIRYEYRQADPTEVVIMDFGELKEYRIYAGDKIFFESLIQNRLLYKAQRDGLIPAEHPPDLVEKRIFLRKDELEGRPCEIILLIRSVKDKKELGSDYTLLWEAPDLNRQPLRVAYYLPDSTLTVVDFQNVRAAPIDPTMMQPPSGYVSMTPY